MALGALLTHIRHKAQTARIVRELEAKFGLKAERQDSTKPDAAALIFSAAEYFRDGLGPH